MRKWAWWGVAIAVWILPLDGEAYRRSRAAGTEMCLCWKSRTLPWTLDASGSKDVPFADVQEAIRDSFDTWSSIPCSDLRFEEQPPVERRTVGYDGSGGADNLIVFRTRACAEVVRDEAPCHDAGTCANAYDCWDFSPNVIAVTTTSYRQDTGQIVDADIELNEARFLFSTVDEPVCTSEGQRGCVGTDVANTVTHEIGHMLGLDHSEVAGAAMYASAEFGETSKRELARDDEQAICDIYPAGEPTNVCEEAYGKRIPRGGGGGCTQAGGQAPGLAAIGLLLALRRRR